MSNQQAVGVAAALVAAGISAVALLLVRNLVRTREDGDNRALVLADGQRGRAC